MASETDMTVERVLCCNILPSDQRAPTIFRHPIFSFSEAIAWPPPHWREVDCNFCCHPFDTPPVPLPFFYDRKDDVWHVFGIYCSWNCAKAAIYEQQGFNCGERVLLLENLARSRFQYRGSEPIVPAPPRSRLRKFSGPGPGTLTIEEFRLESEKGFYTTVISPPLLRGPSETNAPMVFPSVTRNMNGRNFVGNILGWFLVFVPFCFQP